MTYGHDEGVTQTSHRVGKLIGKLDVVMIEPATGNVSDTIESSNASLSEKTRKKLKKSKNAQLAPMHTHVKITGESR